MVDGMLGLLERNGYVARALTLCCLGCWDSTKDRLTVTNGNETMRRP